MEFVKEFLTVSPKIPLCGLDWLMALTMGADRRADNNEIMIILKLSALFMVRRRICLSHGQSCWSWLPLAENMNYVKGMIPLFLTEKWMGQNVLFGEGISNVVLA